MGAIASQCLIATHPELHHYTTFSGLKGITESNTLWATHFSNLNDNQEIFLLEEPLRATINGVFEQILVARQRDDPHIKQRVSRFGGFRKAASLASSEFVQILYDNTFRGAGGEPPFAEPFIVSFCSHAAKDDAYERENGLLSQWRGYGKGGGFCIVFDTVRLAELLSEELNAYWYMHMQMDAVHYAISKNKVEALFPDLMRLCALFLEWMIERRSAELLELFPPFFSGATLFKHQGFKEEGEIRIVAAPGSRTMYDELREENPGSPTRELKTVLGRKRRRIILFDNLSAKLPIKRVIVGPSRHQQENFDRRVSFFGHASLCAVRKPRLSAKP